MEKEDLSVAEIFDLPKAREPRSQRAETLDTATQAGRVLLKFGGARRLAFVLKQLGRPRDPATIYKWTYPQEKGGTGGTIPNHALDDVIAAARLAGVFLTADDLDPRVRK